MSEPLVNVITPAAPDALGLISIEDLKILLKIPEADVSNDVQLQMVIDQNSAILANKANRYLGWAKEKVSEWWDCVGPVCCPDGACKIWLTHAPVKLADIESIESPAGVPIDKTTIRLEELTGKIIFPGGCSSEILITYTGGYSLPDEAPLDLQQATGLMVQQFQTQAAQAATGGSGVRLLAHKESRIMYFSPKDMAGGSTGSTSPSASISESAVNNLLKKYTRYWI
jgi:hypothetical protein